ncbi:hypothetical protein WDU94_012961 [Cyamophila willieti]
MRGAWSHIIQHVQPKQEIQQINQLIADYKFHKINPETNVEVSVHKPEDVILYKKREQLKKSIQEKKKEETLLDEEIMKTQKQLQEKSEYFKISKYVSGLQLRRPSSTW